ncbi:hypothetical protein [Nocardia sp. NBC_00403]|uniref:hypothetical protein n=1 Tax=Nocardia sp. NBC_00403 TaxID=2975990 RepID=UPI002E21F595
MAAVGTSHLMIPGWPYSLICAFESGHSSWTAQQMRRVVENLIAAGHGQPGDPNIWVLIDAGYDAPQLAFLRVSGRRGNRYRRR